MSLLPDTHVWLWLLMQPDRLRRDVRERLQSEELVWSSGCVWEIAVKHALGKLALPSSPAQLVQETMVSSGAVALPVTHQHALRVAELPMLHRDPFDRLLVAQAQVERLVLVTADPQVAQYDVEVLPAA